MLGQTVSFQKGEETIVGVVMDKVSLPILVASQVVTGNVAHGEVRETKSHMMSVDHYAVLDSQAQTHFVVCDRIALAKKSSIKVPHVRPLTVN